MKLIRSRWLICFVALLALAGCSGNNSIQPPPGSSPVSLTITDAPPAGVTILSFEITVTGAVLNPGNVQLVAAPKEIEVKQLETESAFLSTVNVPAGTYNSITVSLANPEITFLNQTGGAIGSCTNNAVCETEPNAAGNITFSGSPFPVTIHANSPTGFQVDVNLANIITNTMGVDFSATNAITVSQLPLPGRPNDRLDEIEDLEGVVQNLDTTNRKFDLNTFFGTFPITTNNNTEFEDFDACTPTPNVFACLANGQVVEVDVMILAGGVFLAEEVELEDQAVDDELEGVIFKVNSPSQFELVVLEELRQISNVDIGNPIVVTLTSTPCSGCFRVDEDGLPVPAGLFAAFENASDTSQLLPGQAVQIRVRGLSAGPPISVTTDRVRLRRSRFTATVSSVTPPNFDVNNLPPLFTNNGITTIQVQTSSQTDFDGVAGVSGLATGNIVSLRGLLFKNAGSPPAILIAKKVRKR